MPGHSQSILQGQSEQALRELAGTGISEDIIRKGGRNLEKMIEEKQTKAYAAYLAAEAYRKFVLKRRDMRYILSALQALKPMVQMPILSSTNAAKTD